MPRVRFDELPDHGRLWVFPLNRDLTDPEAEACMALVDEFLGQWAAHGAPLRCASELREQRFLLVGVDVDAETPSGCSIDALVNRLKVLGKELSVTFVDHSPVWYRDDSRIRSASRSEFRTLAKAGSVSPDGAVFDTSLTQIGQVRAGRLERPAMESWHGAVFFSDVG